MPRLAPVRSRVRRGVLADEVGINGSLVLRHARLVPGIDVLNWLRVNTAMADAGPATMAYSKGIAAFWTTADATPRGGIRCGRAGGTDGGARIEPEGG